MRHLLALACLVFAQHARADAPRVAVDIPAVHSLVAQVMGDLGAPVFVMKPGASPHGYALRPSEAQILASADILIWIGADQSPWLAHAHANLAPSALSLELLEDPSTQVLPARSGIAFSDSDPHDHGAHDPHAWLDPVNAQGWLAAIAAALASRDPANAATYAANAANARADLAALTDEITADLKPYAGTGFITFHDAFQYFEARFSLPATAAISLTDAAPPGPARIAALRALMADRQITCAF
ncbi:MAG TPA: zinc ABC transporter substrate-binding protein, partial [Paracoccaceae bacterium]|nr:zinc ABC transporter substrate-binding protein [Paracoccaceae bacterium]